MDGIIYQATNIQTGQIYIGKTTKDLNKYSKQHINAALSNKYKGRYFHNAIRKYGPHNFKWTILGKIDVELLNEAEQETIWLFNSQNPIYGYNMTSGGDGVSNPSEQARKHISDVQKGKKKKPLSEETKQKLRDINLGLKKPKWVRDKIKHAQNSDETKQKISMANKGKHRTQEQKDKISSSKKGKVSPKKGIKLTQEQKDKANETRRKNKELKYGIKN